MKSEARYKIMDYEVENYLKAFSATLSEISQQEQDGIIQEIKRHIYESINEQNSEEYVLEKLGSPEELAKAYLNSHHSGSNTISSLDLTKDFVFFGAAGLSGIIVIPTLFALSAGLILGALGTVLIALLNVVGITHFQNLVIFGSYTVEGILQIPVSIAIAIPLFIVGVICWKLLKMYMSLVYKIYYNYRIKH